MTIPLGKKIAIVGPSGSGKSTILKTLATLVSPSEGTIKINKSDMQEFPEKSWLDKVTLVSQDSFFMNDTIWNNMVLGNSNVNIHDLENACKISEIYDFIISLPEKFETVIGERGTSLSGGQRQRLALARALCKNPDILMLDEATSALDYETERKIQENLDSSRGGMSTIIVAHRLSTIQNAAIIFVVNDGTIVQTGSHSQLVNENGLYAQLINSNN
ncbi:hypothetical protein A3842_12510 [Paenibacillus sp. P3E]|nr:hypothetical protein A3842_12510 [Paenibacillus sp. P3E]